VTALTTLAAVKSFLTIANTNQDALIASLIARESKQVENYTGKTFPTVTRTLQHLNGTGTSMLMLPDAPVIAVTYLAIDNVEVPVSTDGVTYGYQVDDTTLYLVGAKFPMGRRNVVCSWSAGYRDSEADFIPSGNTPTLTPTNGGTAAAAVSVISSTGVVYAEVGNAPVAAQFSFNAGVFTFNSTNVGALVTMTYDYVPGPVEQTVIEMVAQDLKGRDNIGVRSRSIAGEVISYTGGSMTMSQKQQLYPYRKLVPS